VGLVSESKLRRAASEKRADVTVGSLAGRQATITPEHTLVDAIVAMDELDTRQLAVVDRSSREVVGIIALEDVMRAQAAALNDRRGR
jgi:CBS domain-containing protein